MPRSRGAASTIYDRLRPLRPGAPNHVAFGTFCHVASALRESGLRRWTGPFDWIFSTPGLIADCLDDGFAAFLDPIELRSVPAAALTGGAKKQCRHLLYEARYGLPTLFNHHDPAASGADLRSLRRAASRLEAALAEEGSGNILYLLSEVAWPAPEIERLAACLGRRPSRNVLAVVTVNGGASTRSWAAQAGSVAGCHVLAVEVATATRSTGTRFADPADDVFLRTLLDEVARRGERTLKGHI